MVSHSIFANDAMSNLMQTAFSVVNQYGVHLFQNNYSPVYNSVLANFVDASFPGYHIRSIAIWIVTPLAVGVQIQAQNPVVFTQSASAPLQLVYGFYIKDNVSNKLLMAYRDPNGPYPFENAGDNLSIQPTFTCLSQYLA